MEGGGHEGSTKAIGLSRLIPYLTTLQEKYIKERRKKHIYTFIYGLKVMANDCSTISIDLISHVQNCVQSDFK